MGSALVAIAMRARALVSHFRATPGSPNMGAPLAYVSNVASRADAS